jgi:hypothetical protein
MAEGESFLPFLMEEMEMAFNVNDAMPIRVKDSTSGAIGYETAVENVIANLDAETNSEAFSAAVDKLN